MRTHIFVAFTVFVGWAAAGREENKEVAPQPRGMCTVNGKKYPIGFKWQREVGGHKKNCTCQILHKKQGSAPRPICVFPKGCPAHMNFSPIPRYYNRGEKENDCECILGYHPSKSDYGLHYHWRCASELKHCQDHNGVVRNLGAKWFEVDKAKIQQTCKCMKIQSATYPVVVCVTTAGCESQLSVGGKRLFSAGEVISSCKCFYDRNILQVFKGVHYHWVCDSTVDVVPYVWKPDIPKHTAG